MTVHLRDLNLDNLLTICRELPNEERRLWEALSGVAYQAENVAISMFRSSGFGWIIHNGDRPLAAAGFSEQRPGVYRTWMAANDLCWSPYGRAVTEIVKGKIQDILTQKIAHRVETITLADRKLARDWYPKIGLQLEATHKGYGINGEDAVIYVALRDKGIG